MRERRDKAHLSVSIDTAFSRARFRFSSLLSRERREEIRRFSRDSANAKLARDAREEIRFSLLFSRERTLL